MITMVVGGFFLSFCFGRMANIVGKLDAEKSARNEQVGLILFLLTFKQLYSMLNNAQLFTKRTRLRHKAIVLQEATMKSAP
jgi:hypothetical protein